MYPLLFSSNFCHPFLQFHLEFSCPLILLWKWDHIFVFLSPHSIWMTSRNRLSKMPTPNSTLKLEIYSCDLHFILCLSHSTLLGVYPICHELFNLPVFASVCISTSTISHKCFFTADINSSAKTQLQLLQEISWHLFLFFWLISNIKYDDLSTLDEAWAVLHAYIYYIVTGISCCYSLCFYLPTILGFLRIVTVLGIFVFSCKKMLGLW